LCSIIEKSSHSTILRLDMSSHLVHGLFVLLWRAQLFPSAINCCPWYIHGYGTVAYLWTIFHCWFLRIWVMYSLPGKARLEHAYFLRYFGPSGRMPHLSLLILFLILIQWGKRGKWNYTIHGKIVMPEHTHIHIYIRFYIDRFISGRWIKIFHII
jgi:hypothetical protein